jgi:hypothetical protein
LGQGAARGSGGKFGGASAAAFVGWESTSVLDSSGRTDMGVRRLGGKDTVGIS